MPYWFDGNNLMGQSAATAREDRATRKAFLSTLSSYHKSGGGRFLVFFDGDDPSASAPPPGISVRYSAPDSADAVMLRRLREIQRPAEVTIITNDRDLMIRCRDAGAKAWSWQQFTSQMQTRTRESRRALQNSQERVDVDDWMRYFGIDKGDN